MSDRIAEGIEDGFRSGFVAVVGRRTWGNPRSSTGWSVQKVSITSPRPQTTRGPIGASATAPTTRRSSWTRPAPRSPATLCAAGCNSKSSTASPSQMWSSSSSTPPGPAGVAPATATWPASSPTGTPAIAVINKVDLLRNRRGGTPHRGGGLGARGLREITSR